MADQIPAPLISLPATDSVEELRKHVEHALNQLAIRVSKGDFTVDVDANSHRITNVARPTEQHDAVNVEFLSDVVEDVTKALDTGLNRPRKIAARPGPFKRFTAEHFLMRPELRNATAEPHIGIDCALPAQANIGAGLQDMDVLKRNTDYVIITSPWDTLSVTMDAVTTTMTVANGAYFKDATTYKLDSEVVRVNGNPVGNAVVVDRGQELTVAAGHTSGVSIAWFAKIVKEAFSPDENGVLSVNPIIDNSERVAIRTFTGTPFNIEGIDGPTSTATASLAAAPAISDFTADPRFGEVLLEWSETGGSTYRYQLFRTVGSPPAAITFVAGQLYDEFDSINIGDYVYTDPLPVPGDVDYVTSTFNYGVQAINILGSSAGGDTVGPLVGDVSPTNPANDVTGISAAEGPDCMEDGVTMSEVTCSWTNPVDASNWGGVSIYMLRPGQTQPNYVGGPWTASPQKFETEPTGETVTLYFVSQNKDQVENNILSSPNTTVLLDGQVSAPVPVSNLACQTVVDGLLLSWSENAECDLDGYEIADTGNVTPNLQSDILDRNVIANVKGAPGATRKITWLFKEVLYTGSSDGTVITMSDDPGWNTNQHVVKVSGVDTGKNVQFTLTNQNVSCVSNTSNTITFAAASIPTGTVDFFIRGSDGDHRFYVRAYNKSGFKSEWRPSPPSVLACPAFAPDGSIDDGIAQIHKNTPTLGDTSYFTAAYRANGLAFQPELMGVLFINAAAKANNNFGDRRGIDGVHTWMVRVTYDNLADGTTNNILLEKFPVDTSNDRYGIHTPQGFAIISNGLRIPLENASVTKVEIDIENYFGFAGMTEIFFLADQAAPYFTGQPERDYVRTISAMTSAELNLGKAQTFLFTLTAASTAIPLPGGMATGALCTVILKQDATGGRQVTWDAGFLGPSTYDISGEPNKYNVFIFQVLSSTQLLLISPPILGI